MQQEMTRRNLSRLKGERKADTTFGQDFPLFRLGAADWGVNITRYLNGSNDIRMNLSLGALVAGGEATVMFNHTAGRPFESRSQNYRWRQVNNNRSWLRQVSLGRVATDAVSTLTAPLNGFQLNNTPTTYRRSFGTYILSNVTQPGWLVELYVNNILINYTRADASGFFMFEVPMVYGNSNVKLRFYGPWGEEQTKEQTVVIPVNFLPQHQFEYNLTGGIIDDSTRQRFGRAHVKYGLDNSVTIGAGVEYLSGVTPPQAMPYVNASMRVFS
jgi:outer membrane usher protein FimD/PapC